MPLFIDHLARVKKLSGTVVKTVSGSDLMNLIAEDFHLDVLELPVGFKYIAAEMLSGKVLVGGEESGGIGFGGHIPERDAIFAVLILLETLSQGTQFLYQRLDTLKKNYGSSYFDRIDLPLENHEMKRRVESFLKETPPKKIEGNLVTEIISIDGVKLRLNKNHWLMFRFSGTEPLLRIYCEAPTKEIVNSTLKYAISIVNSI
tara:strand:- start:115 stop:723 length:609 start_codon:yes stop_codon:yes gene_type:complete